MNQDFFVVLLAEYFPYLVAAGFAVFAFLRSGTSLLGKVTLLAQGFGAAFVARGLVGVIRLFVHRPRPFVADPALTPLFTEASYSFPSGHSAFFFALATVAFCYDRRAGIWFYLAAFAIGAARVLAHVHYATDILGGAILGALVGWFVYSFLPPRQKETATP